MYNTHRGMLAHQVPSSRLTELLDQIRAEFDSQVGRAGETEQHREVFVQQQIAELERVRQQLIYLEGQHVAYKNDSERRIAELQRELDARGPANQSQHANSHAGPPPPAPPAIGHGSRDLFGTIMAGTAPQQQPLGLPPQEPQQPQGLPAHLTQNSGLNTGSAQQSRGPPPAHQGFGGYPSNTPNGYGPPPNQTASPGPRRGGRGPPGPATPQQPGQPGPYPGSPRGGSHRQQIVPTAQVRDVGNNLSELELSELPPEFKKDHDEWWAIFNPKLPRRLDVDLLHTLNHKSVVCCVRFSHDGRYVATGCNRAAQIFEVESGQLVAQLEDESADKEGDLYIRSVCFSPDGQYLATGAEDKIIRVWNIQTKKIKQTFHGHEQDIYSLDFSVDGLTIASGSGDKTVRLWHLDESRPRVNMTIDDGVTTVALSRDGRLVAAGSLDRSVRVWDTETGTRLDVLDGPDGHEDSVYSVAFSPSGHELVSGSLDKTIKMWALSPLSSSRGPNSAPSRGGQGRCIHTFRGHADFVLSVALTPDGNWVLSGSKDRGVCFWDPTNGQAQLYLQGHKNSVISVAPSPAGPIFATGSGDQKARIWRYTDLRADPRG